jgi:hypothetical protein
MAGQFSGCPARAGIWRLGPGRGEWGHESSPAIRPTRKVTRIAAHRGRGGDFFVAGGPVAPDRPATFRARQTSSSSSGSSRRRLLPRHRAALLRQEQPGRARSAGRLRAEGRLAAIIDLSQLGSRDGSTEVGRWYYGLAYRVLRDLRLKLDLQAWWQERMTLPPAQRLGEFFWESCSARTRAPVTIFLDEIDSVEQLDYATELFNIVRACHDMRAASRSTSA